MPEARPQALHRLPLMLPLGLPISTEREESMLALSEVLLLLLLRRASSGFNGRRPLALAKRLRTSVKLMTPVNRPDVC